MEISSLLQYQKCPKGKGKISDDICINCQNFEGYVDTKKSYGLMLQSTKDKKFAYNIDGIYFYLCKTNM